ncbi:MAG: DEAD/DEAH box helicase [bacterium]
MIREQLPDVSPETRAYREIASAELRANLNLPHPLRPYQWRGVHLLTNTDAVLLADEMGLGKTVQVAVALQVLFLENCLGRALVVAPASLRLNWCEELRKWTNGPSICQVRGDAQDRQAHYRLPTDVLVASYEQIRADIMAFMNEVSFDVVVLDEAQRIKNPDSQTALACKLLSRERSWALTGTPVENRIRDLISVFRFVNFGLLNEALSQQEIHRRMQPYFLRRRKCEVMEELPPVIDQEIHLELQGPQQEAYQQAWRQRLSKVAAPSQADLLAAITKLKQICNYDPETGASAKWEVLEDIVEALHAEDDKLLVFSQYVETLKWLSARITDVPSEVFFGGLSQSQRADVLTRFREHAGPCILLVSLQAGGVGLNIQEASTVVLFDRWWNPAVENQAVQRAHRFGRSRPLHVIRFLVKDTIEDRIAQILRRKQSLFDSYVEGAPSAELAGFDKRTLRCMLEVRDTSDPS